MTRHLVLLVAAGWYGLCAAPVSAQTAVVELVRGSVATSGTAAKPTFAFLEEGDRLVSGTRIHLGAEARAVLVQTRNVPGGPPGGQRQCVTWTIIGGVDEFTVRDALGSPGACQASPANVQIADATRPPPFVQRVTFVDFVHDKADLPEPAQLARLRAQTDTMRTVGQTPEQDLAISFTLEGNAPGPFSLTGVAANKTRNFYPCVRLQFFLATDEPDGTLIKVGSIAVTLRRVRPNEQRTFKHDFSGQNSVGLDGVTTCQ